MNQTLQSANAWAELGRLAAKKAQEQAEQAHFGTSEVYRTCAEQCFKFELTLRNLSDSECAASQVPGGEKSSSAARVFDK